MPTNDPEYMREYQRKRRARLAADQPLGVFIVERLDNKGVDAILEGVKTGKPEKWQEYERRMTVDDVKKAIEPEKVKESRGKLSKGLGEVPGLTTEDVAVTGGVSIKDTATNTTVGPKGQPKPDKG